MSFAIRVEGLDELKAEWQRDCSMLVDNLRSGVAHATQVATRIIKQDVPVVTGELQRSVRPTARNTANGATGSVSVTAGHAGYVLDGTPPHHIVSRSVGVGGVLRWEAGGQTFFRRGVYHPGTKPQDYLYRATDEAQGVMNRDADRAVDKLVR